MNSFGQTILEFFQEPGSRFRQVMILCFVITVILVALHFLLSRLRRSTKERRPWNLWDRAIYVPTVLAIALLASTAFYATLQQEIMRGWSLFAHVTASGILVTTLLLLAITWSASNRFAQRKTPKFTALSKLAFWIMLLLGWSTATSMTVGMLPLFSTETLERILDIHRYSGLGLAVATMIHAYSVWVARRDLART